MIISKEKGSNFQRWQAGSFDSKPPPPPPTAAEVIPDSSVTVETEVRENITLPTAEEIEQIYEESRTSGYEAGFAAGEAAGTAASTQAAQEAIEESVQRFGALIDNLQITLNKLEQSVADQLLSLAIEIAKQITRGSIAVKQDALLPVIREAISLLPFHHAHLTLRLNPADADNVRAHLGEQFSQSGTQIIEDTAISLGGCQLQAGASEIDATIETRWKRVLEAIGTEPKEWLIT